MFREFVNRVRDAMRIRPEEELEEKFDPKAGFPSSVSTPMPTIKLPNLPERKLTVVKAYLIAGKKVGYKLSLLGYGSSGMSVEASLLSEFAQCEREYAALGYRPIDPVAFMRLSGWNHPLPADQQPCTNRLPGERVKFHEELVRHTFREARWTVR